MFSFDDPALKIIAELPNDFDSVVLTVFLSSSTTCICQISVLGAVLATSDEFG